MRTTVELDKKTLAELLKITGHKRNALAVAFAVRAFLNRKKARDFGRMLREGKFDYPMVSAEA
jgi:Arc/MetJ family transcription regulator